MFIVFVMILCLISDRFFQLFEIQFKYGGKPVRLLGYFNLLISSRADSQQKLNRPGFIGAILLNTGPGSPFN